MTSNQEALPNPGEKAPGRYLNSNESFSSSQDEVQGKEDNACVAT